MNGGPQWSLSILPQSGREVDVGNQGSRLLMVTMPLWWLNILEAAVGFFLWYQKLSARAFP